MTRRPADMLGWDEAVACVGCRCDEAHPRLCCGWAGPMGDARSIPYGDRCECECHQCDEARSVDEIWLDGCG